MRRATVKICDELLIATMGHLLPEQAVGEEAAFLFAECRADGIELHFCVREVFRVPSTGYTHRSNYYLELTSATRAEVIKRAHDIECSLIEIHSHPLQDRARFSWSDLRGFDDFVPHVWWRLRGRPYAALVISPSCCDGVCWVDGPQAPERLHEIVTDQRKLQTTGLTIANWESIHAKRTI